MRQPVMSKIYNLIKTLSEDLTIIVIAHRLNAIKNADNIIIFEQKIFYYKLTLLVFLIRFLLAFLPITIP